MKCCLPRRSCHLGHDFVPTTQMRAWHLEGTQGKFSFVNKLSHAPSVPGHMLGNRCDSDPVLVHAKLAARGGFPPTQSPSVLHCVHPSSQHLFSHLSFVPSFLPLTHPSISNLSTYLSYLLTYLSNHLAEENSDTRAFFCKKELFPRSFTRESNFKRINSSTNIDNSYLKEKNIEDYWVCSLWWGKGNSLTWLVYLLKSLLIFRHPHYKTKG